jgi:FKBP-type peptidyl-prolyl cis-trans isomerase
MMFRRLAVLLPAVLLLAACDLNDFRSRPVSDPNAFAAILDVQPDKLTTSPTGLRYRDLAPGSGAEAKPGETLKVRYTGWLSNGQKFDSGVFSFVLGRQQVIEGWDQGLEGMRVGGRRKLVIPPELGYGSRDMGQIPPNSTLVFDVELLGIGG